MKRNKYYAIILSQLVFLICLPIFLQLFSYLHHIVIFVLWMCVTVFVCFSVFLLWKQTIVIPRFILNVVFIIYACCLLILLFFRPGGQVYDSWNLVPFSTVSYFLSGEVHFLIAFYNLAANIGLFIPTHAESKIKAHAIYYSIPFHQHHRTGSIPYTARQFRYR